VGPERRKAVVREEADFANDCISAWHDQKFIKEDYPRAITAAAKMIYYIHVKGKQYGITTKSAQIHVQLLEETIKRAFSDTVKYHGVYYHQIRKKPHPSWLRRELFYAWGGRKGIELLEKVWYNTWMILINLKVEGDMDETLLRALLGLNMKVENVEVTEIGPNRTTKCMRNLRDGIPWPADALPVETRNMELCRYFGERFGIGRDI
jgi:hypothetical protein